MESVRNNVESSRKLQKVPDKLLKSSQQNFGANLKFGMKVFCGNPPNPGVNVLHKTFFFFVIDEGFFRQVWYMCVSQTHNQVEYLRLTHSEGLT